MKQYKLKKDTPEFPAGTIFTMDNSGAMTAYNCFEKSFHRQTTRNFDEWFEFWGNKEYRRQLIASVNLDGAKERVIRFHMLKTFYYHDTEWGFVSLDQGNFESVFINEYDSLEERSIVIHYLNQLISDGYIEIEDNPNIVWEDEKCD